MEEEGKNRIKKRNGKRKKNVEGEKIDDMEKGGMGGCNR